MMLGLLAAIAIAVPISQDESPRQRTTLPNGARVLAERMAAPYVSVQLFASARGLFETPETHGYRHLLEHLIAKGKDGTLGERLETLGMITIAETYRDATQFEIRCNAAQIDQALNALREFLSAPSFSSEAISKEARIVSEEFALADDPRLLSMALWARAFKETGLDPMGSPAALSNAHIQSMTDLHKIQFSADCLALAIVGPIDVANTMKKAEELLAPMARTAGPAPKKREKGEAGHGKADGASGEAFGALVKGLLDPNTTFSLAAALALASEFDDAFVTYTPSVEAGLVIVGRSQSAGELGKVIEKISPADEARLFSRGRELAKQWVERYLKDPSGVAFLRGFLYVQSSAVTPETMFDNISSMTFEDFRKGLASFKAGACVSVTGGAN